MFATVAAVDAVEASLVQRLRWALGLAVAALVVAVVGCLTLGLLLRATNAQLEMLEADFHTHGFAERIKSANAMGKILHRDFFEGGGAMVCLAAVAGVCVCVCVCVCSLCSLCVLCVFFVCCIVARVRALVALLDSDRNLPVPLPSPPALFFEGCGTQAANAVSVGLDCAGPRTQLSIAFDFTTW